MDFVLPSITAVLLALAIIIYVFPRLAPVMLAFFAGAALVYGMYSHYLMFGSEYIGMTWVDAARRLAPQIMVGMVLIFLIGYLLFVFGKGNSPSIPPMLMAAPNTSTNVSRTANRNVNGNSRNRLNNPYSPGT
jgi:hypothetical protein